MLNLTFKPSIMIKVILVLLVFGASLLQACEKNSGKFCYACHQGFSVNGTPPRDFDTCFHSEADYTNHHWVDQNGNDLTVTCSRK
jgi:hypothetical protein